MTGLADLPLELLLEIHLLSLSSSLPVLSRSFHSVFSSTSSHHKAAYLWRRHRDKKTLSHAIRYGICGVDEIQVLERLNEASQAGTRRSRTAAQAHGDTKDEHGDKARGKIKRLKCPLLPRRLFKHLRKPEHQPPGPVASSSSSSSSRTDFTLISYLLSTYASDPNSHSGYPLTRAVFAGEYRLVDLLLEHGADPGLKQGWAVVTAIMNRDKELVRGLIERDYPIWSKDEEDNVARGPRDRAGGGGATRSDASSVPSRDDVDRDESGASSPRRKRKRKPLDESRDDGSSRHGTRGEPASNGHKRVKLEDRCKPTPEMLETAVKTKQWDLVDYLTKKGATPNLNVLKML
ncbi:hypothetical protein JCM10212_005178 [Sporobolomyces blumeae]